MPIVTTLGQLVDAEPALRTVSEQDGLSAKAKYHAAKLAKLVSAETKIFYEQRAAVFTELGVKRDAKSDAERRQHGPKVTEIPPGALKVFGERLKELTEVAVTVEWNPLRSVDLPQAKASNLVDLGPLCELIEPTE